MRSADPERLTLQGEQSRRATVAYGAAVCISDKILGVEQPLWVVR